jgi:hypothetical protein
MAHFAKIRNLDNTVVHVSGVDNWNITDGNGVEQESIGITYLESIHGVDPDYIWRQTSYNNKIRKNYAGVGYTYDAERDAFIPPKPFASWLLNEDTCLWESPVPYPTDVGTEEEPKIYTWDEETTNWVEVVLENE